MRIRSERLFEGAEGGDFVQAASYCCPLVELGQVALSLARSIVSDSEPDLLTFHIVCSIGGVPVLLGTGVVRDVLRCAAFFHVTRYWFTP